MGDTTGSRQEQASAASCGPAEYGGDGLGKRAPDHATADGARISCSLCATPAEWRGEVESAFSFHACDLCRAKCDVDADELAEGRLSWRALAQDRGQLVALAVLILAVLLMPGCGGTEPESEWTPLYILALLACLATVATVTVLCLTSLGRRWGVVETRDDVDAERDAVSR